MKRKIVLIDADKCNGCGLCVPNCAEGAIQVIDGKARLVAENLCDGLGACLGECPEGAIAIEEREADEFDEKVVEKHLKEIGRAPARAHGGHHEGHGHHHGGHDHHDNRLQPGGHGHHGGGGCPSARIVSHDRGPVAAEGSAGEVGSELGHWPVKLQLVSPTAPFFKGKNLLIAADCAPVAYGDFQRRFLKDSAVVIQCPKFGEQGFVIEKLAGIFKEGGITGVTVLRMEVPCCGGLSWAVQKALQASGRTDLPLREVVIGVRGGIVSDRAQTTGIPVAGWRITDQRKEEGGRAPRGCGGLAALQTLYGDVLEHRMRAFPGAFHVSPDCVTWYGYAELKKEIVEIRAEAAAMRAEAKQ